MRIIAGKFKSRSLVAPRGEKTRPTTDRARESLFNVLANELDFENATVLDLFAGTGALGIEALSRGASTVTAIEKDRAALQALSANRDALGLKNELQVRSGDVYKLIGSMSDAFDLILADAPYEDVRSREELPILLVGLLKSGGTIVIEHRATDSVVIPEDFFLKRTLKAGEAAFSLLQRV